MRFLIIRQEEDTQSEPGDARENVETGQHLTHMPVRVPVAFADSVTELVCACALQGCNIGKALPQDAFS